MWCVLFDKTIALISERNADIQAEVFTYSLGTLADKASDGRARTGCLHA